MRLADIDVIIMHQTDGAWLVKYDADEEAIWIPKSMGEYDEDSGQLTLPENYALEKEMI